jgi:hypothetical protein
MMQLVEGNCLRTEIGELPHIVKVHYSIDNINKLVSVLRFMNETCLRESMRELPT